jgi:hypothetical protein
LPLAGLLVLDSLVAYIVPKISVSTSTVFTQLTPVRFHEIIALALVTALTVIYLAYLRTKFYFSTRWLIAAVTYNFFLLFVKFIISVNEFSSQSAKTFNALLYTAFLISLLYILAFGVLYLFFDGKILNKSLHKALIVSAEGKILLAIGLFVFATIARLLIFRLPLFSNTTAASYLSGVFQANTALLSALLFIMIFAAVEAYAQVRRWVDLKYFFVSGVALMLIYHLTWAIFVYRSY